jgi:hypothetical protein
VFVLSIAATQVVKSTISLYILSIPQVSVQILVRFRWRESSDSVSDFGRGAAGLWGSEPVLYSALFLFLKAIISDLSAWFLSLQNDYHTSCLLSIFNLSSSLFLFLWRTTMNQELTVSAVKGIVTITKTQNWRETWKLGLLSVSKINRFVPSRLCC